MLARIGGKGSGEAWFLKRVLRYDAVTERVLWCSGKYHVQDAAATLQLTGRSHECKTADTRGTKGTGATLQPPSGAPSVMYVDLERPEILYATKIAAAFMQSPTNSSMAKLKQLMRYLEGPLRPKGSTWVYLREDVPKYLDVNGDSDWAGDTERQYSRSCRDLGRSPARRCVGVATAGRSDEREGGVRRLQPRDRR